MKILKLFKAIPMAFAVSALLLQGCATLLPPAQDLEKIFAPYASKIENNPVIIVPGIIGSRIYNKETERMLWGALRLRQVLFLGERDDLALPIDKLPLSENRDAIVSKGIIAKYEFPAGIIQFTVYRELLDMLEKVGYKLGDIRNPGPKDTLYVFDYDWRRDNVETAALLAETIDNLKRKRNTPDEKYTLLCHSMGGLIGRYYMLYGKRDVLNQAPDFKVTYEGAKNIKRLLLLAVPNLGSMPVFEFLHKGLDLAVIEYPPYVLFTMPSIYQLMPFRETSSFIDENGNDMNVDLYDAENWKKYGWSIYSGKMQALTKEHFRWKYKDRWAMEYKNFEEERDRFVKAALDRADLFHKSLSFRPQKECACEIMLFGGDTIWTVEKAILKQYPDGKWKTHFWDPRQSGKILTPGDSMITRESLLGIPTGFITKKGWANSPMDISFSLFVTQRHENIHKDATFQTNLLHILLSD